MVTANATQSESAPRPRPKVGVPRGLYFYKFFPLWKAFLENLNCEIIVSAPTSKQIIEEGSKQAQSELCVPMKIWYGHVMTLLRDHPELDYVFIPRYVAIKSDRFYCPKFMILPETTKYSLNFKVPILELDVNARKQKGIEGAIKLGKELGYSENESAKAWYFAMETFKKWKEKARKGDYIDLLMEQDPDPKHKRQKKVVKQIVSDSVKGDYLLNILILGHAYNTYETQINQDLFERLKAMDVQPLTIEMLPDEIFDKRVQINVQVGKLENFWENEEEIMATTRYFLREGHGRVDGVIFLISFACGPDSLIQELVMRDLKRMKVPYLELILDEHSGESGLITRIESFIDMVRREKFNKTTN
jgi:predicted nucleotide-binding protein (sugar kinase/HSP70/actin superfamily)